MSEENVEIVRRCYAALDRRDWEGLWREAHPDFEFRTQLQGSRLGPDEAQTFIEDQFAAFESWVVAPERFFDSDDQVVVWRCRGRTVEIVQKSFAPDGTRRSGGIASRCGRRRRPSSGCSRCSPR